MYYFINFKERFNLTSCFFSDQCFLIINSMLKIWKFAEMSLSLQKIRIHMIKAIKNRTREEVIAAFRQSIQRKHEWQEKAEEDIKRIRMERLQLSI